AHHVLRRASGRAAGDRDDGRGQARGHGGSGVADPQELVVQIGWPQLRMVGLTLNRRAALFPLSPWGEGGGEGGIDGHYIEILGESEVWRSRATTAIAASPLTRRLLGADLSPRGEVPCDALADPTNLRRRGSRRGGPDYYLAKRARFL